MKVFDLHCDTAFTCATELSGVDIFKGALHLSLDRGASFDAWHQVFAVFMPDEFRGEAAVAHYEKVLAWINKQAELFPERFVICKNSEELAAAEKPGVCGAVISVEGGSALAGDIERVETLYNDGVRLLTLTWNDENELGYGSRSKEQGHLKPFGKQAVAKMNELGIIVDVSHLSDKGFWDVCEISSKPFVASHSCARALCNHPRNITKEMFLAVKERDGLVGINFYNAFLKEDCCADIDDIISHIEYFLMLGGEDTICLGSDFDGADMPNGVSGIESMPLLYERMLKLKFPEEVCRKIFFENCRKFFSKAMA